MRLQVRGETRGDRFCFDLGETCTVEVLRGPLLMTQAHLQVGDVREVKIHVERVGSSDMVIGEELIHDR